MKYGLSNSELESLSKLFAQHADIEQVILYGSRAKGNYKPFSDVDITLIGSKLTRNKLNQLALEIDDLLLPYQFDISISHKLTNPELLEHINRIGISIYRRESK